MELSRQDTKILKGIAILLMVLLHLFAMKDVGELYETFPLINDVPLVYYIGLMGDACRPIYLFVTGYAFYIMISNPQTSVFGKNLKRILKLYINYWVVFIIFVPVGFVFGTFKFDITTFMLAISGLKISYNKAWWFFQIYIIIVLLSPLLIRTVKKNNSFTILIISGIVYFGSYLQMYHSIIRIGDHSLTINIVKIMTLLGTSQFSFIVGALFAKKKIFTMIYNRFHGMRFKQTICVLGIFALVGGHAIIESAVIGPINAVIFICLFTLMKKSAAVLKILDYISNHSTNIWLTHMFFYLLYLRDLTFAPKYPLLIFIWLLVLCIVTSYIIKALIKPVFRMIDNKTSSTAAHYEKGAVRS